MGMMGKLKDAQKSAEETKVRMNSVMVSDDAAGGAIRITASANKEIKEIQEGDFNEDLNNIQSKIKKSTEEISTLGYDIEKKKDRY